jgi:hypothetical protein
MNTVFTLSRIKRAIVNRWRSRIRFGVRSFISPHQKTHQAQTVKFTGIANTAGLQAYYASFEHFREDIPMVLPQKHHDYLVAQNYLNTEFIAEHRPKVFFCREPLAYVNEETRRNLAREELAPFIYRFSEPDFDRRMFYVALPDNKERIIRRLRRSVDHQRPALCCIVNRYKDEDRLPLLRERVRFVRAMGNDIDIYGHAPWHQVNGWESFPRYLGPVRNKNKTLGRYTFNLCFENCDEDGYITEKIIQALMAGCIPLYWGGGRFLEETIPAACFIDCKGQDPTQIHQRILAMPQSEIAGFRRSGLEFLGSPQADRFTWKYWADAIVQRLLAL